MKLGKKRIPYVKGDKIKGITYIAEAPTNTHRQRMAVFACPVCGEHWKTRIGSLKSGVKMCRNCYLKTRLKKNSTYIKPTVILTKKEFRYLKDVLDKVSLLSEIPIEKFNRKGRQDEITSIIKQLYFYLAYTKNRKITLSKVGSLVNRSHSAVLHGIENIRGYIKIKDSFVVKIIKEYNDLSPNTEYYTLSWKQIDLVNLLKTKSTIQLKDIEESYIPYTSPNIN